MACRLSRTELIRFNIGLDENQRCQARYVRGDGVECTCNSLLSEHAQDKKQYVPNKPQDQGEDGVNVSRDDDDDDNSTFCGRLSKRVLHAVQVMLVTYLAVSFFIVMFASGINFEIATSEISNIMISSDADVLQFWYRASFVGLSVIEYEDDIGEHHQEVEEMYVYSSAKLDEYTCDLDVSCENTVENLSNAWDTLLISSSVCALLCIVSWLLAAPRNVYPCLYNTKMYQAAVREEKPVLMWFIKPIGLTYLVSTLYTVAFGVQFTAFFKYVSHLPSNEDVYRLSLHYINSDHTLCSVSNPCEFSFESIDNFNRNVTFIIASIVCVGVAVALVALSHRLQLKSLRWSCFGSCYSRVQQERGSDVPSSVPTEDIEHAPTSPTGYVPASTDYSMNKTALTGGPLLADVVNAEVQMVDVDLESEY